MKYYIIWFMEDRVIGIDSYEDYESRENYLKYKVMQYLDSGSNVSYQLFQEVQ